MLLQVRSAFAMAFTTLTNAKAIMGLGPSRSILGTIIRPDAVLLERKRGSSGELTLQTLLPGAGEPLKQQFSDKQEIYCNWQLDDEEEPLPRGHGISEDGYAQFSRKKRRASKESKPAKKVKENRDRREEIGTTKERSAKKQRWRHHYQRNGDSNRQSGGGGGGGGSSSSHHVY